MKKFLCALLIFFIFVSSPIYSNRVYDFSYSVVYAQESANEDAEEEIMGNIENQLANLDTYELDLILKDIANNSLIGDEMSFSQKIQNIINGELSIDATSFFEYISQVFIDDIIGFLPYMCLIIAIAVLYSMVNSSHSGKNKSLSDVIHFVCYGATVVIVVVWITKLVTLTTTILNSVQTQMGLIFPLLLTVLTALGGSVSVSVYQPAMAMLSGTVVAVFSNILMPIFTFMLVFTIISHLTTNIKFNKFADFFGSVFKWIMGIVLMLFSAFVSIQGLMAGSIDGVSIKTAKYTIKSAVPIIGGFLSDGVNLIMASSMLIKNAIGVGGILILFATILGPIIKIVVFSFLMKLASAILEPIADSRITNFVSGVAKCIQLLVALILGVVFMYFITVGLVMCSANVF